MFRKIERRSLVIGGAVSAASACPFSQAQLGQDAPAPPSPKPPTKRSPDPTETRPARCARPLPGKPHAPHRPVAVPNAASPPSTLASALGACHPPCRASSCSAAASRECPDSPGPRAACGYWPAAWLSSYTLLSDLGPGYPVSIASTSPCWSVTICVLRLY